MKVQTIEFILILTSPSRNIRCKLDCFTVTTHYVFSLSLHFHKLNIFHMHLLDFCDHENKTKKPVCPYAVFAVLASPLRAECDFS